MNETTQARKAYNSVTEMIDNLSESKEFAKKAHESIQEREFIDLLMSIRAAQNMSQEDIAKQTSWSQSKVSKLENGKDADVRWGDLCTYASALNLRLIVTLAENGTSIVDRVKTHACIIGDLLQQLVDLAGDDRTMSKGVRNFLQEAAYNLARIVKSAVSTLKAAESNVIKGSLPQATESIHYQSMTNLKLTCAQEGDGQVFNMLESSHVVNLDEPCQV